jgi:hypothetical protein
MTSERITQQTSSQDTMPPPSIPIKPNDFLYSNARPSFLMSQPNSLNSFMGNGSSLSAVRSAFLDMEKQRSANTKAVNFECDYGYGYGYGYGKDSEQEPAPKRRRMQRRNSKTPAMLMSMAASLVQLEFLDEEKKEEEEKQRLAKKEISEGDDDDDDWDGGLEIAEELVKHLQQRRRSNASSASS